MKRQINVAPLSQDIKEFHSLVKKLDGVVPEFDIDIINWKRAKIKTLKVEEFVDNLPQKSRVNFDIQMDDPVNTIDFIIKNIAAQKIIINLECDFLILPLILKIKEAEMMVGIGVNPENSLLNITKYLDFVDYVQIMTVQPGVQGNPMLLERLGMADNLRNKGFKKPIGIDGGINLHTIELAKKHPIEIFSVGSFICKSPNPVASYKQLQRAIS